MYISGETGLPLSLFAQKKTEKIKSNTLLFSHARGGVEFFLKKIRTKREKKTLLIPGYICADFAQAIISTGVDLKFYQIDDKFNPVIKDVFEKIDNETFAVVVVHYFGFLCQSVSRIVDYCRQNNVKVIEDFAHFLYCDKTEMNIKADVAVFSLKKLLPLPDGGLLYGNSMNINKNTCDLDEVPRYHQDVYKNTAKLVLKNYLRRIIFSPRRRYSTINDNQLDRSYSGIKRISDLSESIFRNICQTGHLNYIRERRRENFHCFADVFSQQKTNAFTLPFNILSDGDIPYMFPVRLDDCDIYNLVDKLRRRGIPVISWPRLDKSLACFARAEKTRSSLLFFPLHEGLQFKHIEYMCNSFKKLIVI